MRQCFWYVADPDDGYRLCIVREGIKGYFPCGEVSNDPAIQKPMFFRGPNAKKDASEFCKKLNQRLFQLDEMQTMDIIRSSMVGDGFKFFEDDKGSLNIMRGEELVLQLECDIWPDFYKKFRKWIIANDYLEEYELDDPEEDDLG